jgi:ubiquinone/menaquinone biosynthesis C-methylase UbiE
MRDSKERFSDRVDDYRKYRPGYPEAVLQVLEERCGLSPSSVVADIGSGTGILTGMLLSKAHTVYAVEPNAPMRSAAEEDYRDHPAFRSVAGSAEATTLPSRSVDLITAAQAFHWFDPEKAKAEFRRILRKEGNIALIWNERMIPKPAMSSS